MKKIFKAAVIVLVVAAIAAAVIAAVVIDKEASDISQFEYETVNGEVTVTRIDATGTVVEIPSEIEGNPVTGIGGAVISYECSEKLLKIKIPETVENIGYMAFHAASALLDFEVDKDSEYFSTDSKGVLYSKDKSVLVQYPLGRLAGTYKAHKDTKIIGDHAFYQAEHLKKAVLPEGVTEIREKAFYNIYTLKEIVLPDSLEIIRDGAMSYDFEGEKLPAGLKEIGEGVFAGYKGVDLVIPEGVVSIAAKAFENSKNLETVTIPASVESIASTAFTGCEKLVSFTVDAENEFLSSDASGVVLDKDGTKLVCVPPAITEYAIPEGVTYIGQEFLEHKRIKSLIIPSTVETMAEYAFYNCSAETLSFAENTKLECISKGAFADCNNLKEINIPEGVKIIEDKAFAYCNNVEEIAISGSVEKIGDDAFLKNSRTAEVTVPENVKEIGNNAFGYYYSVPVEKEPNRGKIVGFKIYGAEGSAAQMYAEANGFDYESIG
ncbi:MAG: leucine-rich repeat protein [Clostridia bacterium]|nr:leucine-rich repeat protein [Clostridia bacterium]